MPPRRLFVALVVTAAALLGCSSSGSSETGQPTPVEDLAAKSEGASSGSEVVTTGWLGAGDDALWLCPTDQRYPCPQDGLEVVGERFGNVDPEEYRREIPGGEQVVVAGTLRRGDGARRLRVTERLAVEPNDRVYGPAITGSVTADLDAPSEAPRISHLVEWDSPEPVVVGNATSMIISVSAVASDAQAQRAGIDGLELRSDSGGLLVLSDAECPSDAACRAGSVEVDTSEAEPGSYPFSVPVTWQEGDRSGDARLDGVITITASPGRQRPSDGE